MIKEAIDRIIELAKPLVFDVDGTTYLPNGSPLIEPKPSNVNVHNLQSLVDFALNDEAVKDNAFIHIVNPTEVDLISQVGGNSLSRTLHCSAKCGVASFPFGQYMAVEEFIVNVMCNFVDNKDRENIIEIVGNLTDEKAINTEDDGVSQKVSVRAGVSRKSEKVIKNPIMLAPYRTFPEIYQPTSPFIFRVGHGPTAVLFYVKNRDWEIEAFEGIKTWLSKRTELKVI